MEIDRRKIPVPFTKYRLPFSDYTVKRKFTLSASILRIRHNTYVTFKKKGKGTSQDVDAEKRCILYLIFDVNVLLDIFFHVDRHKY